MPTGTAFADQLAELGFAPRGQDRTGGRVWALRWNTHLEFTLHEEGDNAVLSWRYDLGEFLLRQGWQIGAAETSFQELYPQSDVRVPARLDAVEGEVRRVLSRLRLDLGDPQL